MTEIEVLDAIMGSGKTTGIIKWMKDNPDNRYLYVSPMLTEVEDRIPTYCAELGFVSPSTEDCDTKSEHLLKLVKEGKNVAFTHSLFQDLTKDHLYWIRVYGYVLIIDEEIDFIESYSGSYTSFDILALEKKGHISVDEDNLGRVMWHWDDMEGRTAYSKMRRLCELGMLFCTKRKREMMVLHLPLELITSASRVLVLTYLFKGSVMEAFMRLKGINIKPFTEVTLLKDNKDVISNAKSLIEVLENRTTRRIKNDPNITLSATWYKDSGSREDIETIKKCIRHLYVKHGKNNIMFTCRKDNAMKFKRGTKSTPNTRTVSHTDINVDDTFLYCSAKATNDYSHKNVLIHAYNRFCNIPVKSYLQDYGSPIQDDDTALSELIQWIWRSAIREDKPIKIYFLSDRMERLFLTWLEGA